MAPHQRSRVNGQLIQDSFEIIGAASLSISHLEKCLESGAEIKKQDGKWHLFAADGNGIKCRETLPELLLDLPPLNTNALAPSP